MRVWTLLLAFVWPVQLLAQQPPWVDPSSHSARLVQVAPTTRVEVLDWGGSGRTLVLLAQLGQTAHIYDEWAPKLTRSYRVLAITRRGHGESVAAPDASLTIERLGLDIVAVLDAMNVPSPVLVGHGFAGEETNVNPGCRTPPDESVRVACAELFDWTSRQLTRSQAMVRTIGARTEIVQLPGAGAFAFLSFEGEVVQAIDRFVSTLAK